MYKEFNKEVSIDYYLTQAQEVIKETYGLKNNIDRNKDPLIVMEELFGMCENGSRAYNEMEFLTQCLSDLIRGD